jgi:hypothetical protein
MLSVDHLGRLVRMNGKKIGNGAALAEVAARVARARARRLVRIVMAFLRLTELSPARMADR